MLILPACHHSRRCAIQHSFRSIHQRNHRHHPHCHQFVDPRHSRKLHVQCETRLLSVQTSQNCPLLLPTASDFLTFESIAASAASSHCVLKTSARRANLHQLPTRSPSALVVPLVANTVANSLEVRLDVSANKMLRMFTGRTSLLISEFMVFNAWPTFVYCSVNRRVLVLHSSSIVSSWRIESEENLLRTLSWVDLGPTEKRKVLTIIRATWILQLRPTVNQPGSSEERSRGPHKYLSSFFVEERRV